MAEDTVAAPLDDPAYRIGVIDLLGALAYGELTAFERLAEDATMAPTLLDKAELATMASAEFGHFTKLRERLEALGVGDGEAFWLAVRTNLAKVSDAASWWAVVRGPVAPVIEDPAFAAKAAEALPQPPWDGSTWKTWTEAVRAATGARGKALFMPLRRALTGRDHGPELAPLLPLIGPDKARARLSGLTA